MSYTNKTTYYELPQYIGTDKPTYLGDFNGAMVAIDTAMHNNEVAAAGAQSTADSANNLANTAATQANNAISQIQNIGKILFPVGSIYLTTTSTNPSSYLGGTWEAWGAGKIPVGFDSNDSDFNSSEKTGGSKQKEVAHSHTLTTGSYAKIASNDTSLIGEIVASLPNYQGQYKFGNLTPSYENNTISTGVKLGGNTDTENIVVNTTPPYIVCYMWKRIA